ncbi:sugar kinase [Herbiconiux sp. KACC 21604]|uniref:sugar kinase n=1 Tax=unclassified Herbiconiux TaxID=2618217 RepID=UPI00149311AB|nr:sugar kinase [Herbiconiux sp. SALV-R1]QJU55017.1 sugar kinase [Herbiconiux sp. SALV-R1]WPO86152.1 sugar kinase [Herbiconiux sp. KACC 21604]
MRRVATIGEALATLDVGRLDRPVEMGLAGAELNTAVGLARLGVPVSWVSRVADDAFGVRVVEALDREGIDAQHVLRAAGEKTGLIVTSRLDEHTVRSEHYRVGSAASRMSPATVDSSQRSRMLADASLLHLTGITPALGDGPRALVVELVALARTQGIAVSFDVNHRPQLVDADGMRAIVDEVIDAVDTLFCNEVEAELLTGESDPELALRALAARGPRVVVVKLGRRGAIALVEGRMLTTGVWPVALPTFPVGAGDSFNAAWIALHLEGVDPAIALPLSAWVAAQVVAHPGDHEGFPARTAFDAVRRDLESGATPAPALGGPADAGETAASITETEEVAR